MQIIKVLYVIHFVNYNTTIVSAATLLQTFRNKIKKKINIYGLLLFLVLNIRVSDPV